MNKSNDPRPGWSEIQYWDKVKSHGVKAGREVILLSLKLYYAMQNAKTPKWAKAVIIGALGYFISPLDTLPDFTPFVGFTDDLGILAAAVATVAAYIDDEAVAKANEKLKQWFGD